MARTIGSISGETLVTIPIAASYIMTAHRKRYVFMAHVQPRIHELGDAKLYDRFVRTMRNNLYNTVKVYGLAAVDIDDPQISLVSVRLQFQVVEDPEFSTCTLKDIKKSAPRPKGKDADNTAG
jgi:hypothetical protein